MRAGADFPTVWHSIIKQHPAAAGIPIQRIDEAGKTFVEIPLVSGGWLVIHHDNAAAFLR